METDPVIYTVRIEHWADGTLVTIVHDVSESEKSRESVAWALRKAADQVEHGEPRRMLDA